MGVICGALVGIIPFVLLNHKHLELVFVGLTWQKMAFIFVCTIGAALLHIFYSPIGQRKEKFVQYFSAVVYLCLYTTCAALCERLYVTMITLPTSIMGKEISDSSYLESADSIVPDIGLVLVVIAVIIEIYMCVRAWHKDKTILGLSDWAYLVFLVGVSLLFSVWLPLLALPGAAVLLKWQNRDKAEAYIK